MTITGYMKTTKRLVDLVAPHYKKDIEIRTQAQYNLKLVKSVFDSALMYEKGYLKNSFTMYIFQSNIRKLTINLK